MQKIALITCSVDAFDDVLPIPEQTVPYDYFFFDENNLPRDLGVSNRMLSKYPKLFPHKLLPGYKIYVWIDGRIEITSNEFVEIMTTELDEVRITAHPDRQNVQQEFDYIEYHINNGSTYLRQRYSLEQLATEKKLFDKPLTDYPLYASGIFARRNTPLLNRAFEHIWEMCLHQGNLDQVLFSLIESDYHLKFDPIPFKNPYFKLGQHLKEYRKW